jgi:signal transduction histidine kinase
MVKVEQLQKVLSGSRRLPFLIVGLNLLVLAGALLLTTRYLRGEIRKQIINRDGETLSAVALMHAAAVAEDLADLGSIEEPDNQSLVLLKTSRLSHVLGARLFDRDGRFRETFPADLLEARLDEGDLPILQQLKPISHFEPAVALSDLFYPEAGELSASEPAFPLLKVNVPLHAPAEGRLVGIAQFLIEAKAIATEFARLDRNLFLLALVAFLVGGGLLAVAVLWAFGRLRQAQDLLADRTRHLLKANQELALAAKTSAVGAVTSHLIHGLRNPLSGLRNFMAGLDEATSGPPDPEREEAVATTRRMQALINEIVAVLREQDGADQYEITLPELVQIIDHKVRPRAREAGVDLLTKIEAEGVLTNRAANLVSLILMNLIQNALQASAPGRAVRLGFHAENGGVRCEVADEGPGFPEALRSSVFTPCVSSREGGGGIGLAISKQLANHLGGALELRRSDAAGCVFALSLPADVFSRQSTVAASAPVR